MQAGFAKAVVNPPLGMPMEGLGQQGGCERIHDDLFVRALYLSHEGREVVILGCDLLFFERPEIDRFKGAIGRKVDLSPAQILLNTSHMHAGPRLTRWSYSGAPDPEYLAEIERAMVQAVTEAHARQQDVTLWTGMAHTRMPVSRRKPDAAGQAQWAPYRDGIICDALPYCLVKDAAGNVLSLLFSVSCHPSMIYSLDISADYPGVAMCRLNEHFHTDGSLFLQGAGGDTKPRQIAVDEDYWRHGTWEDVEAAGTEVADAVIQDTEQGLTEITPDLKAAYFESCWPYQTLPSEEYLAAVEANPDERRERKLWVAEMQQRLQHDGQFSACLEVGVHALQLGKGLRLIGFEGELVGELGNLILGLYDRGITFPMGYTDGCQIYLPSTRMVPEHGYEVDSFWEYHRPAPLAPHTDDTVRVTMIMLRDRYGFANE